TSLPDTVIQAISPRGSELLVISRNENLWNSPLWLVPLPSGPPRRLGDLSANNADMSPDAQRVAYLKVAPGQTDLYIANSDGSSSRKVLSMPYVAHPRFTRDGRHLRFDVADPQTDNSTIWEAGVDGSGAHPIFPANWNKTPQECCGTWTPDGKYYIFEST